MDTKKCNKCNTIKPKNDFFKSKRNKDGCRSSCKVCENKANRARDVNYKKLRKDYRQGDTYKEIKRNYYRNNKDKILTENAAWRQTFKGKLLSYKVGAEKREIEWRLSDDEFKSFWQKPCSYCGSEIETIGVDRLDSSIGYTIDNCTACCTTCNRMKLLMSKDEFINQIKLILKHITQKL